MRMTRYDAHVYCYELMILSLFGVDLFILFVSKKHLDEGERRWMIPFLVFNVLRRNVVTLMGQ